MQYHLVLALSIASLLLHCTPAAAKHAECYWKGPGTGTPEQQGFSIFGTAKPRGYSSLKSPTVYDYICHDFSDEPVVATWSRLKPKTLEMTTPCGGNGFSGDCTYGLWAFKLNGFTDPSTNEKDPVRYMRKTDDCEWIGTMEEFELPETITIYHK